MNHANPKITVIIPTRERADTLYFSLKTVTNQNYDNLDIIVSDNFSQDNTKEIVSSLEDSRVKYINTGKRISMSHNWEFALNHVHEGWVTFLGDDDGILPGGIERVAQIIRETGTKAVTSRWRFYFWPGSTEFQNQLTIPLTTGYETRRADRWIRKLMQGTAEYPDLPHIYTGGFADISAVNGARTQNGDFFCSMIPDVYSAIALGSVVKDYIMMKEPVAVMGVSSHSNGASNFGLGNNEEPARKFFSETNIPFHPMLGSGRTRSVRIIIYESYLQAFHLHNDELKIDIREQLALALAQASTDYYPELLDYCKNIATKNGIDLNSMDDYLIKLKIKLALLKMTIQSILLKSRCLTIDVERYQVRDVYGASELTRVLHKYHTADRRSIVHNFITEFKDVLEKTILRTPQR